MNSKKAKHQKIQVLYDARTQFDNLGDLIINKILIDELRKHASLIINIQGVPLWYQKELSISSKEGVDEKKIKFRHRVILGGLKMRLIGEKRVFFVTNPGHHSGSLETVGGSFLKLLSFLFLLKLSKVKVCSFGVSIGPFVGNRVFAEKFQASLAHFYSVRDSLSISYAESIGIKNSVYFPDLAWLIETKFLSGKASDEEERDFVIFSFRNSISSDDVFLDYKSKLFDVLDIIADYCTRISKRILVVYQVSRDYELSKEIFDRYKHLGRAEFIDTKIDVSSMEDTYSKAYMTFSNRLHVLMFSMACGSLPIGVIDTEKHTKILGIFSDSTMDELVVDISSNEVSTTERLESVVKNSKSIKEKIIENFKKNRLTGKNIIRKTFKET